MTMTSLNKDPALKAIKPSKTITHVIKNWQEFQN